ERDPLFRAEHVSTPEAAPFVSVASPRQLGPVDRPPRPGSAAALIAREDALAVLLPGRKNRTLVREGVIETIARAVTEEVLRLGCQLARIELKAAVCHAQPLLEKLMVTPLGLI